jgi:hypothetical protein
MPTSNECRQRAEECYRLAGEAKTEADRLACLELARTWLETAVRQDEMAHAQFVEEQRLVLENGLKPEAESSQMRRGWRQWFLRLFR